MSNDPKVNTPVRPPVQAPVKTTPPAPAQSAFKPESERLAYPPMLNEAPASVNFYFITKKNYNCQMTLRDTDEIRLLYRMSQIISHLESVGCQAKPVGQQPEKQLTPGPKPANGNSKPAAPVTPPPPATSNAPAASVTPGQRQSTSVVKMKITPQEGGKITVDFFAAGHQYPDVYDRMKPEQLLGMLTQTGPWTMEHLTAIASYQVSFIVDWEFSERINSKGNPYKSILAIRPG